MTHHKFDKYFAKHGHYPRFKLDSGVQRLTVEFAPGYVRIASSSPFGGEVYITRSAFLQLLRRAVPLARQWHQHQDFDVPAAVHRTAAEELAHSQALRAEKRQRKWSPEQAERQKRRFAAARARAHRQASQD